MSQFEGIDVIIGCGEFAPGTKSIPPPSNQSPPPKIIPKHRRIPDVPPLPRRDPDDPGLPAGPPSPGTPGRRGGGPPTNITPGPTSPGGGGPGGGGTGTGPTTPGPTFPPGGGGGVGGPITPGPTFPPGGGGPRSTPTGPVTPGPGGPGTGGPLDPVEEPPRRFFDDPEQIIGISPTVRLDDPDPPRGGDDPPIPTLIIGLRDARSNLNSSENNASEQQMIAYETSLFNQQESTNNGTNNFPGPKTNESIDLRDNSQRSMFSNSFNGNNLYDPIYNILDYSTSPTVFVANTKHRTIFGSVIAEEIDYLINRIKINENWEEKFITGLTLQKLTRSLNSTLLEAFDTILDVNGIPVGRQYFLTKVFNHLISGTLNEFDAEYYLTLADSVASRKALNITQTQNEQSKKNYALSLISDNSMPADSARYQERHQIEVARMRFLLTDIEATFDVETIDGTEYQLQLEDAGVEVEYAPTLGLVENVSLSSDYVPPGEGDGYYYKIETELGTLLPLILDTEIQRSYFIKNNIRQLVLDFLGENSNFSLTTTIDTVNSEFSSGYYESYTASAQYFKLNLKSIVNNPTTDNFIEDIVAEYVKLTDPEEIDEHAKTYGAKVVQFNLNYDDPFIQYADRTGAMSLNMRDFTFRQFTPKRTPSNDSIILRNLPDGFILYPVRETKDNPTGAYSEVVALDAQVSRTLDGTMDFTLLEKEFNRRTLKSKNIWESEGKYSYGLIGLSDTQNIYYVYNASDFPNTFSVTGRTPEGNLLYNIIDQRLEQKYSFDYLTWWDVYRRLPTKQFAKTIFNLPRVVVDNLYQGWLGYQIKDVLYRNGSAPDNLVEVSSDVEDPIYLDGRERNV